jgi:dihydroxyacetone kinase
LDLAYTIYICKNDLHAHAQTTHSRTLVRALTGETNGAVAADAAATAAEKGAEATKTMKAAAGRSSYVPAEVLASVPDPGAVAVSVWLRAIADALK